MELFTLQRYGENCTTTIAMIWHSIYQTFGISPPIIKKLQRKSLTFEYCVFFFEKN